MRKAILAVCIVPILFLKSLTYAQDNEVFEYQKAVIQSLGWAKEAHELLHSKSSDDDWGRLVSDNIRAQGKIRSAAKSLSSFSKSENEFISKGQVVLEMAYMSIDVDIDQSVKFLEKLLNGEKTKPGSNLREMAELGLQADESWKNLVSATVASTFCLIDDDRVVEGKTPYLVITKIQRDELVKELEKSFGDSVRQGPRAGQYSHEAAASSIYKTLIGQGFKMADE